MTGAGGMWDQLVEAIGEAAAVTLARMHGGADVYVSARPDGAIARAIGVEKAQALVLAIGAGKWECPMGPVAGTAGRRGRVARMLDAGQSHNDAARAAGVHVRTVRRVAARQRQEPGPLLALMQGDDKRRD